MQDTSTLEHFLTDDGLPLLVMPRKKTCKVLNIGLTKLNELLADGEFDVVQLGNREYITTESIRRKMSTARPSGTPPREANNLNP